MVLELSKSFTHNQNIQPKQQHSDEELKTLLVNLIKENGGDIDAIQQSAANKLEVTGMPNLPIHSFLLQAEALGLSVKYTKKTVLEIY